MEIFANALPGDGLKAINCVADDSIPDVPSVKSYAAGVYKLYRAGIFFILLFKLEFLLNIIIQFEFFTATIVFINIVDIFISSA